MEFYGVLWVIYVFMVIFKRNYGVFYGDFMEFYGILWGFIWCVMGFYKGVMRVFYGDGEFLWCFKVL